MAKHKFWRKFLGTVAVSSALLVPSFLLSACGGDDSSNNNNDKGGSGTTPPISQPVTEENRVQTQVTYHLEGGHYRDGESNVTTIYEGDRSDNDKIYMQRYFDLVNPVRDGYLFTGWFTSLDVERNGKSVVSSLAWGHDYLIDEHGSYKKQVDLYATWVKVTDCLTYQVDGDAITITGVDKDKMPVYVSNESGHELNTELVIPATIDGKPVTKIADGILAYDVKRTVPMTYLTENHTYVTEDREECVGRCIETLVLPDTITEIGMQAFEACRIRRLTLPKNLKHVRYGAFRNSDLDTLQLPDGLETIDSEAFGEVEDGIITIPESVTQIANRAFNSCYQLKKIYFNAKNCEFIGGYEPETGKRSNEKSPFYYYYYQENATPQANFPELIIGDSVETAPDFTDKRYFEVVPGNGQWYYGMYLRFSKVTLGKNLKNMPSFEGMPIKEIVYNSKAFTTNTIVHPFENLDSTVKCHLTIGEDVTMLYNEFFANMAGLEVVTLGSKVKTIGSAFANCPNLTKVEVGSLKQWLDMTLAYETPLYNEKCELWVDGAKLTDAVIPEDCTQIKDYAFYYCRTLESITLHDGITRIGNNAFGSCSNLKRANIPDLTSFLNINFDGYNNTPFVNECDLYIDDQKVTDLTIGTDEDGITQINVNELFINCTSLTHVTIGDKITSFLANAFAFDQIEVTFADTTGWTCQYYKYVDSSLQAQNDPVDSAELATTEAFRAYLLEIYTTSGYSGSCQFTKA